MSIVSSKSCTRCSEMKPLTEYHKDALTKDGLKSKCKICRLADNAKYFAENKESVAAVQLAYHEKNKEARNAYQREWREKNKEATSAYKKEYNKKNKEAINAYRRSYHAENREALNARERKYRKDNPRIGSAIKNRRRARKLNNGVEVYTIQEVLETYGTDCHICHWPVDMSAPRRTGYPGWETGLHIDHVIPISKGGEDTLANVRPSHAYCNISKRDRLMGEF